MPTRIARLPRNSVGYPIPWFVAAPPDGGDPDFRVADGEKQVRATKDKLCWVCGTRIGAYATFTIGPMCAINRLSGEPPSHRDCGIYSAQVCPFLATPSMRRRPGPKPLETIPAAGEMIERNPGVTLVWTTRAFTPFRPPMGAAGILYELGDPTETLWFREGRTATRTEVLDSIQAGLPALVQACQRDDNPNDSLKHLDACVARAIRLVPAT